MNKCLCSFFAVLVVVLFDTQRVFATASDILGATYTNETIEDPEKIMNFKAPYGSIPPISELFVHPQLPEETIVLPNGGKAICGRACDIETNGMKVESFGMGERRVVQEKEELLYTFGICDCIGISIWDPQSKTAGLYHASKMELRENNFLFQENISEIMKFFPANTSCLEVNLASCYWSNDLSEVIDLLQARNFRISGLFSPDVLLESTEHGRKIYVNKETTPLSYFQKTCCSLIVALNSSTGEIGIYPSWLNN